MTVKMLLFQLLFAFIGRILKFMVDMGLLNGFPCAIHSVPFSTLMLLVMSLVFKLVLYLDMSNNDLLSKS